MPLILTDGNFEKEINNADKPVLVDFFTVWCQPCSVLAPILEKIIEGFGGKLILAKANLDDNPLTAQKFGINQIPTVVLFSNGKPISGFIGVRPEEVIKEWLGNIIKESEKASSIPTDGTQEKIEEMVKDYQDYAQKNGFHLNPNGEVVKRIIRGLLENEKKYGKKYCPCRRVIGNQEEDSKNICPCNYHLGEIEKNGHCICGLFMKESC